MSNSSHEQSYAAPSACLALAATGVARPGRPTGPAPPPWLIPCASAKRPLALNSGRHARWSSLLGKHLKYPKQRWRAGVQGRCTVNLVVMNRTPIDGAGKARDRVRLRRPRRSAVVQIMRRGNPDQDANRRRAVCPAHYLPEAVRHSLRSSVNKRIDHWSTTSRRHQAGGGVDFLLVERLQ
jgi:hypothetical protein